MATLPAGIVGAGRTRNGLGPFLATCLERAGCRVTAVAGRSVERAHENATALAQRLGHAVQPCRDLADLCASGIAVMVVASPPEHHLPALQAALAAKLAVLCEKPLVHEQDGAAGAAVASAFVRAGLLLSENCQWPFVLPALQQLYGPSIATSVRHVSLGLAPSRPGREMVRNTLSHVLSLAQAMARVDADTTVSSVSLDRPSLLSTPNVLRLHLQGPDVDLHLALHLDLCLTAPRPAWLEIDGARMDRRICSDQGFFFAGNGHETPVADPMQRLVSRFVECVRMPDPARIAAEGDAVCQRFRLYRDILSRLP